jgi:hypothetical protein
MGERDKVALMLRVEIWVDPLRNHNLMDQIGRVIPSIFDDLLLRICADAKPMNCAGR